MTNVSPWIIRTLTLPPLLASLIPRTFRRYHKPTIYLPQNSHHTYLSWHFHSHSEIYCHATSIIILCLWSPSPKHRRDHHRHRRNTLISIVASLSLRHLLLLRLSLLLSDKVKQLRALAFHTIKRQPYGSCQLPITRLQNMIISYNKI